MDILYRDDVIARTRLLLKWVLAWAISSSLAVVTLSLLCAYVVKHRQTHWLPLCTGSEFNIGETAYSPGYLKDLALKVIDLRLTYSPDTIEARVEQLVHLIPADFQRHFKRRLEEEVRTVQEKNISSVFYADVDHIEIDISHHQGRVAGVLHRTSHGLPLKEERKTYLLQFALKSGLLMLQSIKEVSE
ncbi:TPA: TraE/TraK family type IV conjugative transfer system protein [Legionella feeleii]